MVGGVMKFCFDFWLAIESASKSSYVVTNKGYSTNGSYHQHGQGSRLRMRNSSFDTKLSSQMLLVLMFQHIISKRPCRRPRENNKGKQSVLYPDPEMRTWEMFLIWLSPGLSRVISVLFWVPCSMCSSIWHWEHGEHGLEELRHFHDLDSPLGS